MVFNKAGGVGIAGARFGHVVYGNDWKLAHEDICLFGWLALLRNSPAAVAKACGRPGDDDFEAFNRACAELPDGCIEVLPFTSNQT
jgi:hypothetical protein